MHMYIHIHIHHFIYIHLILASGEAGLLHAWCSSFFLMERKAEATLVFYFTNKLTNEPYNKNYQNLRSNPSIDLPFLITGDAVIPKTCGFSTDL